ncbi:MAG: endoplasmic oxidoreductin-1 [Chrysothrix sp. TS-e1954]|nr:MAG: endoplasmic oxidoreductin-1 [Chrysothrix sp. TS-e1954]
MGSSAARRFFLAAFVLLGSSTRHQAAAQRAPKEEACAVRSPTHSTHQPLDSQRLQIDPKAIVSDACASFSTLDALNSQLHPTIRTLTNSSDFFSYYRLNLYDKACPFWSDESSTCGNIACAVNTIENEDEIPTIWRAEELGKLEGPKAGHPNRQLQRERDAKPLMGELGADVGESCVVEYDDECDERDYCVPEDESAAAKGDYVSLVDNPERFTGYSGPGAQQVWEAIYRENCFSKPSSSASQPPSSGFPNSQQQAALGFRTVLRQHEREQSQTSRSVASPLDEELDDECLEKRVFYRIISGMHASISTHLCHDYLNQTTGTWGPNLQCYQDRLQTHPERISNLYFNYAVVLRAVAKVRTALSSYTFCSGDPAQDGITKRQITALADQILDGPSIYDESLMFQDPTLKGDFRARFRNVSRTMDCVGCDKCRLWGKLQTAGYGAALKILFEFDELDPGRNPPLRRTELVALINTLEKISTALVAIAKFEGMADTKAALDATASASGDSDAEPNIVSPPPLEYADPEYPDLDPDSTSDDGDTTDEAKPPPPSNYDDVLRELHLIWRTLTWVLKRWTQIPTTFLRIFLLQLQHIWQYWLGLRVFPDRSWAIRTPTRDEM